MALVLGLSQCKKNDVKPAANTGMQITLSAAYGGEKTVFNNGTFTWNTSGTEYIYVGCEGQSGCIGTLTATGNGENELVFSGSLDVTPAMDATVYFFYLGNGAHAGATTLDFSNQTSGNVTDFHIAVGSATYTGSTDFYATLQPIMAIAKLDLSSFGGEYIYVYGDDVYASATINYNAGTITKATKGYINIGTGSAEKYVALIPSTDSETTIKFASNSHDGSKIFGNGIQAAKFYALGNNGALAIPSTTVSIAENAAVPGLFSVAGTDGIITKMARFSQGNLQATNNTANSEDGWTWSFAPTQYSIIGDATANTAVGDNVVTTAGTVDLFGWVGANSSLAAYGINNNITADQYGNTTNEALNSDWSVPANAASLGGHSDWMTLTSGQWKYILSDRTNASQKYGHGKVGDQNGLIILPDAFVVPDGLSFTAGNSEWTNSYTTEQWAQMEANGAVFLPAAGSRYGTTVNGFGSYGFYWSSTSHVSNAYYAYIVFFYSSNLNPQHYSGWYHGYSVRLARVVE